MTVENPKPKVASRSSWKILPMPKWKSRLRFKRSFTQTEFSNLAKGLIPENMDDKWVVFLENNWLYFHRSWTGACIYQIQIKADGEKYDVTEAWVNHNLKQYVNVFKTFDKFLLGFLVNSLSSGKKV